MTTATNPSSFCETILNGALACEDASLQVLQYGILNRSAESTAAAGTMGRVAAYFADSNINTVRSSQLNPNFTHILNIAAMGLTYLSTIAAAALLTVSVAVKCGSSALLGRQITWEHWPRVH